MLTVVAPPPPMMREIPAPLPQVDGENLAEVALRLRQEVEAASTRNLLTAKRSIEQVGEVRTFETRARDTLRTLMEKMSQDHGERG